MTTGKWGIPLIISVFFLAVEFIPPVSGDQTTPALYDWRVVRVFPHDSTAFTQGLIFRDGYLYESTGRRGHSSLRKVRLETGEVIKKREVDEEYFAEGLTDWNGRLVQLTLSSGTGFVYDLNSFDLMQTFSIEDEGWGLTNDGYRLIMSDGSSTLRFLDPETFRESGQVTVTADGEEVSKLNELEMIDGRIFANRLGSDRIFIIDPGSGEVTGQINLNKLVTQVERHSSVNVLNGIAYDADNDRIFVTGKMWPKLYEIEIQHPDSSR